MVSNHWDNLTFVKLRPSSLRGMQQSVADPKYEGVRTSRKDLLENEEDNSGEDDEECHRDEDDESDEVEEENKEGHVRFKNEEEDNSGEDDEESHRDEDDESDEVEEENKEGRVRFNIPLEKQDLEKGQAVKRQVVCPFCLRGSVFAG